MSFTKLLCTVFLFFISVIVSAQEAKELEYDGLKYVEETITAETPYTTGFFSKETKIVKITGVLMLPVGNYPKPFPLVIFNHGSQDGGTEFMSEPRRTRNFLIKGYSVFVPFRKGFWRKGSNRSEASADVSEPIPTSCNGDSGVQSAISDVKALLEKMVSSNRTDLDFKKIILTGTSRGGFLSLALAANDLPGVVLVVNNAGGWFSERCGSYMLEKFPEYGRHIKVPVLSFYGTNDSYYNPYNIKTYIEALGKNDNRYFYLQEGGRHGIDPSYWWPIVEKFIDEMVFPKTR